jgi:hypothetical protein
MGRTSGSNEEDDPAGRPGIIAEGRAQPFHVAQQTAARKRRRNRVSARSFRTLTPALLHFSDAAILWHRSMHISAAH